MDKNVRKREEILTLTCMRGKKIYAGPSVYYRGEIIILSEQEYELCKGIYYKPEPLFNFLGPRVEDFLDVAIIEKLREIGLTQFEWLFYEHFESKKDIITLEGFVRFWYALKIKEVNLLDFFTGKITDDFIILFNE